MTEGLKLFVPPPIVGLCTALVMGLCPFAAPGWVIQFPGQAIVTVLFALVGVMIDAASLVGFIRAKTTVNPIHPERARTLVVSGFYRFSRNPMYLGMLLLLVAWLLWLGTPLALLPIGGFLWFLTRYQIVPEEKILREKFGADYDAYCKRVRRWM